MLVMDMWTRLMGHMVVDLDQGTSQTEITQSEVADG